MVLEECRRQNKNVEYLMIKNKEIIEDNEVLKKSIAEFMSTNEDLKKSNEELKRTSAQQEKRIAQLERNQEENTKEIKNLKEELHLSKEIYIVEVCSRIINFVR